MLALVASAAMAQGTDTLPRRTPAGKRLVPGKNPSVTDSAAGIQSGRTGVVPSDSAGVAEDRYQALQRRTTIQVPVMPRLAERGPEPLFARTVFDRDSIDWLGAETVGDLVALVPGAFVWRGGRRGRPEPVNYEARGSSAVEYVLDGMPYVAVGPDSVSVDPSLMPLSFLDRVEVERWPGRLEVRLYTRRHDRLAPRSDIAAATGSDRLAIYAGGFEQRFQSGFGVAAAGDYLRSPATAGTTGDFTNSSLWLQGSYVRPRIGLQYQLISSSTDRDAFTGVGGGQGQPYEGKRTDAQFRASFGHVLDRAGPRLDLVYSRTGWDSAGIAQQVNQIGGVATIRQPTFTGGVSAFQRNTWTSFDSRAWAGWTPVSRISVSGEAAFQHHYGGRSSRWLGARGALALPLGFAVGGAFRVGSQVAAPSLLADTAQSLRDVQLSATLNRGWIGGEATYARGGAFSPLAYQPYPGVVSIAPYSTSRWIILSGHIAPWRWMVLDGWFSNPAGALPEGQPRRHYMASGSIRSKFLRQFPSGYFDLKLQLGVEGWAASVAGRGPGGAVVALPAGRVFHSLVQMEIGSLRIFWDARNITNASTTYVPGFVMPGYSNAFGIRWGFLN